MAIQVTKRPYSISFSGNPIHYELTSALAASEPEIYFEIRLQFKHLATDAWQVITVLPYTPINGVAQINVQDLLHAQLGYAVPTLPVDEKTVQPVSDPTGWFYLEFREITAQNPSPSWDATEVGFIRAVIKGGVNYFYWQGNNFWVNYFEQTKPFLTWQKNGRLAAPGERIYLLWFNRWVASTATVVERVRVTYTDGTTSTFTIPFPAGGDNTCFYLPAGSTQLSLGAINAAKTIHYWEIQVVDTGGGGTAYSEIFRYYQDNRNDDNGKTLLYRNSLGGLDSVRVRGVIESHLEYSFKDQDRPSSPDYYKTHVMTAQRIITGNKEVLTYKGDIGHLSKEEQDRLRDLQLIREVYTPHKTKWLPVNLVTKSFKLRSTQDTRWTMPIEWQLAYDGADFFTPENVDLGDAVFSSNVCLAKIAGLSVTINFNDPGTPATDCLVTFTGNEIDTQNASTQFRWRVPPEKDWQTVALSALPVTFQFPRDLVRILEVQSICTNDILGTTTTAQINTNDGDTGGTGGDPGGDPVEYITCTITNNRNAGDIYELFSDSMQISVGYIGAGQTITVQMSPIPMGNLTMVFDATSPNRVYLDGVSGSINYTEVSFGMMAIDHDFTISIL